MSEVLGCNSNDNVEINDEEEAGVETSNIEDKAVAAATDDADDDADDDNDDGDDDDDNTGGGDNADGDNSNSTNNNVRASSNGKVVPERPSSPKNRKDVSKKNLLQITSALAL